MVLPDSLDKQLPEDPQARKLILLRALERLRNVGKLSQYDPHGAINGRRHQKQINFHEAGAKYRVRLFAGGNRTGKTVAGGAEVAIHLTGRYPKWWKGRVFQHPIRAWAGSDTSETTRDIDQMLLLGPPDAIGTGLIPKEDIIGYTRRQGISDALDTVRIRNQFGGVSTLQFKSYDQGRKKWQGTSKHLIWLDEEPPYDIFREAQQRTLDVGGLIMITATPLNGMSDVMMLFWGDAYNNSAIRHRVDVSWADNPWLDPKEVAELEKDIPDHELEARRDGRPTLGSGRIYPFARKQVCVEPFAIPRHWPMGIGMDFGWNWTAAVWMAHDQEGDTLYLYADYKHGGVSPAVHTSSIKQRGLFPVFADPSGWKQVGDQQDGRKVIDLWQEIPDPLDLTQADNAVGAGIMDCFRRFEEGRLKIFTTCLNTLAEFDLYRRDEKGKVVKKDDHLMDAMRYDVRHVSDFRLPDYRIAHSNRRTGHVIANDAGY